MNWTFTNYTWRLFVALGVAAGLANSARADGLPTHGAVIHLNPFIPGWPVPPAFPPPGGGVIPGDGNPPDAEYDVLGPMTTDSKSGGDSLVAPLNGWHWETEIDLDPYLGGGSALILFDFRPVGGGTTLRNVPFVGGPDIRLHVHQQDVGGETGGFSKFFANLTTNFTPAWGVSVTENPDPTPFPQIGGVVTFGGGGEDIPFPWEPTSGDPPGWQLYRDPTGQLAFGPVPEPCSLVLFVIGVGVAGLSRRRRLP